MKVTILYSEEEKRIMVVYCTTCNGRQYIGPILNNKLCPTCKGKGYDDNHPLSGKKVVDP